MRMILAVIVALAACCAGSAGAATTDEQKLRSAMGKVALPYGSIAQGKMKALCVCRTNGRVGVVEILESLGDFYALCDVPSYDADGALVFASGCNDWIPLVK